MATLAYSYVRFSTPEQAKGDSLRRQTDAATDWCARHSARLDKATTLHDLGRSAYLGDHRKNADRYALAGFLKLVESGKVPRGSYLIIENLDRLSREHIQPALMLVLGLLQAGVRVVQLKPAEMTFDDKSDMAHVMMMVMELSRGHSESLMKSQRVGAAWAAKKHRARANGEVLTHMLPAWIEAKAGKLSLVPTAAAAVKRIYSLALSGYGLTAILKRLEADGVQPFATSGRWCRSYIGNILRDRRAMGECQPRRRNGSVDGEAIGDYFPAIVTEDEWHAVRAASAMRGQKPGRTGERVNVFAGLTKHARDGDAYFRKTNNRKKALLVTHLSTEGKAPQYGFPFDVFERAILSCLAEIDPRDILGQKTAPDDVLVLSGELARVEAKIAELEAELIKGDVAALAKVLRQLEGQKKDLAGKLAEARARHANPLSEAWGECQSLAEAIDTAPDPRDARLRLRSLLRRVVDSIWLLVVPRGRDRVLAVQMWFTEGKRCRGYRIVHFAARGNHTGRKAEPETHIDTKLLKGKAFDMRRPNDVKLLTKELENLDLDELL